MTASKMNFDKSLLLFRPRTSFTVIGSEKEITHYSFIVQKSVTYLDLSLCEFSSFKSYVHSRNDMWGYRADAIRNVFTEEAFRKRFSPNRKLLYNFHLDVSSELEFSLRNDTDKETRPFYSSSVLINTIYFETDRYETYLNQMLEEKLGTYNRKVRFVHKISKMAKCLKFISRNPAIRDNGLNRLYMENSDSTVVVDFLNTMGFSDECLLVKRIDIFEFVLLRANEARFDLWTPTNREMINASLISRMFVKAETLFKYRDAPRFCTSLYDDLKSLHGGDGLLMEGLDCPVEMGLLSKERHLLILQVLHAFFPVFKCPGMKALQMLWRSIPDSFITIHDLISVFNRDQNSRFIKEISIFIEEITGEVIEGRWQPRKLKHHCRIAIRRALSRNFQLATGIDELQLPGKLELPSKIKNFLRLVN